MNKIISTIVIMFVMAVGVYFLLQIGKDDEIEGMDFTQEGLEMPDRQEQNQEADVPTDDFAQEFGSQLTAEILRQGTGQGIKNGEQAIVHYVGVLEDGVKFDSSLDRGEPFTFIVGAGQVIQGWDLGVAGMKVGEIRRLYIPSEFGYGESGTPGNEIPPNANLIFEIELLGIGE